MSPHSPPQMTSPPSAASSLSPPLTPSAASSTASATMTNNISQLFGLTNAYFLSNLELAKVHICKQVYEKLRHIGSIQSAYE